jgi:hypothetical protein
LENIPPGGGISTNVIGGKNFKRRREKGGTVKEKRRKVKERGRKAKEIKKGK